MGVLGPLLASRRQTYRLRRRRPRRRRSTELRHLLDERGHRQGNAADIRARRRCAARLQSRWHKTDVDFDPRRAPTVANLHGGFYAAEGLVDTSPRPLPFASDFVQAIGAEFKLVAEPAQNGRFLAVRVSLELAGQKVRSLSL